MSLRAAFSYSMVETILSRVFDLVTLWLVLNNLPEKDIATFGLATSSLLFFNLVFFAPETALFRYQKIWETEGRLDAFLSSFVLFTTIKIALHIALFVLALSVPGLGHSAAYAVIWSAITQQIQLAEIIRIHFRMNLRQSLVAKVEVASKIILMLACLLILLFPSLDVYFGVFFLWSLASAAVWLSLAVFRARVRFKFQRNFVTHIIEATSGFSLWSHISGNLIYYIHNSGLLFLGLFSKDVAAIALYVVLVRVMNLFFVAPMMIQSFVPVVLSSESGDEEKHFAKLLVGSAVIALSQFLFFWIFGRFLGSFFGIEGSASLDAFVNAGFIVNSGILVLNLSRPLATWLMIRIKPQRVMMSVYFPAAALATLAYPFGVWSAGITGAAAASAVVYAFMSARLTLLYLKNRYTGGKQTACA